MAVKSTNATKVAIKKESTFKETLTFADGDVVAFDKFSMTPKVETLDRNMVNSKSGLSSVPVKGASTSSGSIDTEVVSDATDSKKLAGHVLYETVLGSYISNGATITATDIEDHRENADGDSGVYFLSDLADGISTVGVKYVIGGDESASQDIRGVSVTQWKLEFPSQGIVKSSFSLEGSTGFIPVDSGSDLAEACSSIVPFVAKSMTLKVGGVDICATDVSLTVTTEVQDIKCVKDDGVSAKVSTSRKIEGSMTLLFEDISEIEAYNAWATTNLFLLATSADGKTLAIKLPNIQKTSLDLGDDNSVITQSVSFEAHDECGSTTPAIFVAVK